MALFGLIGSLVSAVLLAQRLPGMAERRHLAIGALILGQPMLELQIALLVVALAGFALAASRLRFGWWLAAVGVVVSPFRAAFPPRFTT